MEALNFRVIDDNILQYMHVGLFLVDRVYELLDKALSDVNARNFPPFGFKYFVTNILSYFPIDNPNPASHAETLEAFNIPHETANEKLSLEEIEELLVSGWGEVRREFYIAILKEFEEQFEGPKNPRQHVNPLQKIRDKRIESLYPNGLDEVRASLEKSYGDTQQVIFNNGLKLLPVPGDGNCFFHALQAGDVGNLRGRVVEHMRANRGQYTNFVTGDFDKYLDNMSQNGTWADHVEVMAAMRVLGRPIVVISANSGAINNKTDLQNLRNSGFNFERPIFVFYNGVNHYDALNVRVGHDPRAILEQLIGEAPEQPEPAELSEAPEKEKKPKPMKGRK
jgi:hypothetical protein